ncbi:MAG: tRNA pseudouridine(13) synthase TruD [bacterium]|nr:tRNA pseudouridine(13) synthase TruD [bacterium]MDZ4300006.1 tRNA pseudouridine(13) synthase TruD [Candidatus Sungbacteria bacterium]
MNEEYSSLKSDREQHFLKSERARRPELFIYPLAIDDEKTLEHIGIEHIFGERPSGHLKIFPEDFIVEEIAKDGTISTINPAAEDTVDTPRDLGTPGKTVWATLVKIGEDTVEVVNELGARLNIDKKQIGYAGIKDKYAITAQQISIRNVAEEQLRAVRVPHFFLKDIFSGKGALQVGNLEGNRFSIFIRTVEHSERASIATTLAILAKQGFWNFFYTQRFGTPRLISHIQGRLVLQGRYEEAIKTSLTMPSVREIPYFRALREELAGAWGEWDTLLKKLEQFPYSFRNEQKIITHLADRPGDFIGALHRIPDQVKLWVYAYTSFLFNKKLSSLITTEAEVPRELPLATESTPDAWRWYEDILRADGIRPPFIPLRNFPFIQRPARGIETAKGVKLNGWEITDQGVALDFSLDKGCYATTFLAHLFMLSSGQPVPEGVSLDEIDTKKILGTGTIAELRHSNFKKVFEERNQTEIMIAPLPHNDNA